MSRRGSMEYRGIDISSHNGTINFDKIKEQGLFCLIRVAYGSRGIDKMGKYNMTECQKLGIPFGAYVYSYARNEAEARTEVANLLSQIKGFAPTYPIIIDMEDADGYKEKNGVTDEMCKEICKIECKSIEDAGYYAMIYANKDWFENKLNDEEIDKYDKWLAQWNKEITYGKPVGIWQYTSSGSVDGVPSKRVDMNIAYRDYPYLIKNMETVSPDKSVKETVTVTARTGLNIRDGADVSAKKVGAYKYGDTVSITEYSGNWGLTAKGWICLDYTTSSQAGSTEKPSSNETGTYIVQAKSGLNIRKGPNTRYDKIGAYKYGAVVEVLEVKNGWGRTNSGWISLTYAKRGY